MELSELQSLWIENDKKISDSIRLNKEILRRMLMSKPEKRFNWIKIKAEISLFSPIILFLVLLVTDIQFRLTANFYIGLGLFAMIYVTNYVWGIRYFLLIRKIDFSGAILSLKKEIAELEKYKIKITRISYMLMPFAILGIFLMLIQKPIYTAESIVMLALIVLVYISSIYYTFKYSIYERFRKLNKEIAEIEELEKE
ncbi:hypothetical protein SAMN05444405_10931 [Bacteroides luti]|uniref:Uncharacterized protein n=1 Tax=Bacteroides luti TaxID=1297750 RepID=A0A1M5BYJ3_9BACE|nr:hypothetical protein [Bacteroides luti]SHF47302.1 hypothetical protein SAMN05444405_10931 [Bacteroides luti]